MNAEETENKETKTGLSDSGMSDEAELLRKILESTEKETKYAKRAARFTIGIFLVLFIAMMILIPRVVITLKNVDDAVVSANATVAKANTAIDDIQTMSSSITDTSANMNSVLTDNADDITDAVKKLSSIDFDGLNKAIQDLEDTVGPMANFMNKFK